MINIKRIANVDKCSNCNHSGVNSHLWEVSITKSNSIQGSTLFYRLCSSCVSLMNSEMQSIIKGENDL